MSILNLLKGNNLLMIYMNFQEGKNKKLSKNKKILFEKEILMTKKNGKTDQK